MKHTGLLLSTCIALAMIFSGCDQKENPQEELSFPQEKEIALIMNGQIVLHDIEGLVLNQIFLIENNDLGGVANSHPIHYNYFSSMGSCALWELDKDLNQLILDFGNGCEDLRSTTRSGKLRLEYINGQNPINNVIRLFFEDFMLLNTQVEGNITITKTLDEPTQYEEGYTIDVRDLRVKVGDEIIELSGSRNLLFYDNGRGNGPLENRTASLFASNDLEGLASNLSFQINTISTLQYSNGCWLNGKKFPTGGIETITLNNASFQTNYALKEATGSGCNYIFELSQNERTWRIDLQD